MTILSSGKTIAVTAVVKTSQTKAALEDAVAGQRGLDFRVSVEAPRAAGKHLERLKGAGILLLEVDLESDADLDALERVAAAGSGSTPIVALAASTSLKGVRRLMQLGVVDIVPVPMKKGDLIAAITSANRRKEGPPPAEAHGPKRGRVISVMKAVGGAGATTVAVHMAEALSRRNKGGSSVALVDLDLQFGSVALHLDLQPEASVLDALAAGDRLDPELLRSTATRRGKDLHVFPAPPALTPLEVVLPDPAAHLADICAQTYAQTIIDLPLTWTAWTRSVLAASDAVVLVTQLNVPSVHHTARQIATLQEEGLHMLPVVIAVNRHDRGLFGDPLVKEAEKALGRRLEHFIPSNFKALSRSADSGQTLYQMRTARKVTKRIEKLADAALAAAEPASVGRG